MFLSSALPSMLLLPVVFCTPIHKHECDLNIGGGEGANVTVCYNICDPDCSFTYFSAHPFFSLNCFGRAKFPSNLHKNAPGSLNNWNGEQGTPNF